MSDMGWSRYIARQEDAAYQACAEARKRHGLEPDPEELVDCETCPARIDCGM